MLKKRIIPIQLLIDGRLVKTVQFDSYRDVGDPVASSRVYNSQYADELVFLNINPTSRSVEPLLSLIEKVSEVCFMPLALGGGISTLDDTANLIENGADKVVINSAVYKDYNLLTKVANLYGSQAVIVSVDARRNANSGEYELFSDCGKKKEAVSLEKHVKKAVEYGAGEILINSIDRDGTMTGYDIELIQNVAGITSAPIIACGGAGNYEQMKEAFLETNVSALACGSLFNFGDNNPIRAKAFLSNYNLSFKVI